VGVPAQAAPNAAVEDGAAIFVTLATAQGRYDLDLLASTPRDGGAPRVRISLVPEGGSAEHRLYGELADSALTRNGDVITLQTRVGSLPVRVVWRARQYTGAVSFGRHGDNGSSIAGWEISGVMGDPQVTLGRTRCAGHVSSAVGTAVTYDDGGYGVPLARGLGVPLKGLRCLDESSSVPPAP
jgi:hypothetical protein